ncbi:hypothetical protein H9P43_008148 [Blastocladiella emersonii ATCC 22665]|nr:hypothetical protein H9P43_008148 [Blastocladiella emersonii ATCC 22665]
MPATTHPIADGPDPSDERAPLLPIGDDNGSAASRPDSTDAAPRSVSPELLALFAKPWYQRAPLVAVMLGSLIPIVFLLACVPSSTQAVMTWACDRELQLHPELVLGLAEGDPRSLCTGAAGGLELLVQKRASSVISTGSTLSSILTLFTTSIWGVMCDVLGRLPVFRISLIAYAALLLGSASLALAPLHWNPGLYYFFYAFAGVLGGVNTLNIALNAYLTDLTLDHERGEMFGMFQGLLSCTAMVSPLLGAWIVSATGGAVAPLLVVGTLVVGTSPLLFLAIREPPRTGPRPAMSLAVVKAMLLNPFAALDVFRPRWAPGSLYRFYLVIVWILLQLAETLAMNTWTLFTALQFGWGGVEWSLVMTGKSALAAFLTMVAYPLLARFLGRWLQVDQVSVEPSGSHARESEDEDVQVNGDATDANTLLNSASATRRKHAYRRGASPVDSGAGTAYDHGDHDDENDATSVAGSTMTSDTASLLSVREAEELAMREYDRRIKASALDTPSIAFTSFIDCVALIAQGLARTGGMFAVASLIRSATSLVTPIRSAQLSRLVPPNMVGRLFAAEALVTAAASIPIPMLANWLYRESLKRDPSAGGPVLPGGDLFFVAAAFSLVAFVSSTVVSVLVERHRRQARAKTTAVSP